MNLNLSSPESYWTKIFLSVLLFISFSSALSSPSNVTQEAITDIHVTLSAVNGTTPSPEQIPSTDSSLFKESPCDESDFTCRSDSFCIPHAWTCDSVKDCIDGSDEDGCVLGEKTPEAVTVIKDGTKTEEWPGCKKDEYKCHSSNITYADCIERHRLCDGHHDCLDGTDEGGLCDSCIHYGCSGECIANPFSPPKCKCEEGQVLGDDEKSCRDVNECLDNDPCHQLCVNEDPGYRCLCVDGYVLNNDQVSCSLRNQTGFVYMAHGHDIVSVKYNDMKDGVVSPKLEFESSGSSSLGIAGIDYSYNKSLLYMAYHPSVTDSGSIYILTKERKDECLVQGLDHINSVAVDWVTGNLYYLGLDQSGRNESSLGICTSDGRYCAPLTDIPAQRIQRPRGLVVHPRRGLMIWTRYDGGIGRIEMSGMDGRGGKTIVNDKLMWPSAITMDYIKEKLYYADAQLRLIETLDLNTNAREIRISHQVHHPHDMVFFDNKLYWSDWTLLGLTMADLTHHVPRIFLMTQDHSLPHGLAVDHSAYQNSDLFNPCSRANCSHMCALQPGSWDNPMESGPTYTCLCPSGYYPHPLHPEQCVFDQETYIPKLAGLCRKEFKELCAKNKACFNGGTCRPGFIACDCVEGFSGRYCEIDESLITPIASKDREGKINWVAALAVLIILLLVMCILTGYYTRKWAPLMNKQEPMLPKIPSVSFLRGSLNKSRDTVDDDRERMVQMEDGNTSCDQMESFSNPMYGSNESMGHHQSMSQSEEKRGIGRIGGGLKDDGKSVGSGDDSGFAGIEEALDPIAL